MAKLRGWAAICLLATASWACAGGELDEGLLGGPGGAGGGSPDGGVDAGGGGADLDSGVLGDGNPPVCGQGTHVAPGGKCEPCSGACEAGFYESAACSTEADRVCSPCSDPCGEGAYESEACSAAADRVCAACSAPCDVGSFESAACSPTSDRVCAPCTELPGCAAVTCTTDSDSSCLGCAEGFAASGDACVKIPIAQAYLKAPNAEAGDLFGGSVAAAGDTVVVGAPREASGAKGVTSGAGAPGDNDAPGAGAVYVLRRTDGAWAQEAALKPGDTAPEDQFGSSVAVAGDTVAVGAPNHGGQGAVYVFFRTGTAWTQQAVLKASNPDSSDRFGTSVSIAGDTIAVGAPGEASKQASITSGAGASSDNSAPAAGAVYVFKRTGAAWAQEAYIKASNAAAGQLFGQSVSVDADTLAVGASGASDQAGAAYVFVRSAGAWSEQGVLGATNADPGDSFGVSVSVSGDTVVVGASAEASQDKALVNGSSASADNSLAGAGAAYVFRRTADAWSQEAYLKAANSDAFDSFGSQVAIVGDAIVVAASAEDSSQTTCSGGQTVPFDNDVSGAGAVYLFTRSGNAWAGSAYLKAPNAGANDTFGFAVGLLSDGIVVGAPGEASNQTTITNDATASASDDAPGAGAVYVFAR